MTLFNYLKKQFNYNSGLNSNNLPTLLPDNQARLKDGCTLIYHRPLLMTPISVAMSQWQTKQSCCLTVTTRCHCVAEGRRAQTSKFSRRGRMLIGATIVIKNKPTEAASCCTLCHSNQRQASFFCRLPTGIWRRRLLQERRRREPGKLLRQMVSEGSYKAAAAALQSDDRPSW